MTDVLKTTETPPRVWIWWSPGEPEDDLHGFVTKKDRDAFDRGKPGPFKRVVRNHHVLGPVPLWRRATLEIFKEWDEAAK